MPWNWSRATHFVAHLAGKAAVPMAAVCALALAGCNQNGPAEIAAAQPRGATVAFESIDGLPSGQFQRLVADLNDAAQTRRLAVLSREQPSAYRVRGYLSAGVEQGATTISWVWDVFDGQEHRALRIAGEERTKAAPHDGWAAADDALLHRIATTSMDQLAAFLTSTAALPATATPAGEPQLAFGPDRSSPEAAGIFRVFQPQADPVAGRNAQTPAVPARPEALSARETLMLAASARR